MAIPLGLLKVALEAKPFTEPNAEEPEDRQERERGVSLKSQQQTWGELKGGGLTCHCGHRVARSKDGLDLIVARI